MFAAVRFTRGARRALGSRRRSRRAPGPAQTGGRSGLLERSISLGSSADAVRPTTAASGAAATNCARGLDAVEGGHAVVHEHDVGPELLAAVRPRPSPTDGDDLDVVPHPEQELERVAENLVVLDEHDPDRRHPCQETIPPRAKGDSAAGRPGAPRPRASGCAATMPFDEAVERRRLGACEQREDDARLREQTSDDGQRDVAEVVSARDRRRRPRDRASRRGGSRGRRARRHARRASLLPWRRPPTA